MEASREGEQTQNTSSEATYGQVSSYSSPPVRMWAGAKNDIITQQV